MDLEAYPTTWVRTRTYFLSIQPVVGTHNFGAGVEATFDCPRCNRTLPRYVVTVDHIVSRAQMSRAIDDFVDRAIPPPGGLDWTRYTIRGGGATPIAKTSLQEKEWAKSFIYKNSEYDLNNLLMMCSLCNTRKNST